MAKLSAHKLNVSGIRFLGPLLIGLASFIYFLTQNHYYAPLEIKVSGKTPASAGTLEIYWISGEEGEDEVLAHQKRTIALASSANTPAAGANTAAQANSAQLNSAQGFDEKISLPQSFIKELRLNWTGAEQMTVERLDVIVDKIPHSFAEGLKLRPNKLKKLPPSVKIDTQRFHLGLTVLQVILAATLGWLAALIFSLQGRLDKESIGSTIREIFLHERRWIFWISLFTLIVGYTAWLLAYWPAAMTNDSWMTLAEMRSLILTDWHPYVYTIYALVLFQFGETIAAISFFQILMTALLIVGGLFLAYRNRVNGWIVSGFVVFFAISAPIGMYNITFWKDIPFSLAVAAVSLGLYYLKLRRQQNLPEFRFPSWSLPFIAITLVMLCASRHNGLLFYPLLPVLCIGLLSRKQMSVLVGFLFSTFIVLNYAVPQFFGIRKISASPQQQLRTSFAIMTHPGYFSLDHARDRRVLEEALGYSFERVENEFPQRWFDLFDSSNVQRNQFLPSAGETEEYNKTFITDLMLNNIPILMGSRTYEFFHSLGIHQNQWGDSIRRYQNPTQLHGSNLAPPGNTIFGVSHTASNPFPWLHSWLERYSEWTKVFDGFFSSQVLVWNLLVPFGVMFAVIFLFGGLSAPGLFCVPSIITAAGVFATGAGESWRYFYYVYICGYLVIPLTIAYFRTVKNAR